MQAPRMNIPNIGNNNQQSVHYTTMGQPPTTQTYYNNPMLFAVQPNRPPSNAPVQTWMRVKKALSIVDPTTGKDLTNQIMHTRESKEGASGHLYKMIFQASPQVVNSYIAAQFAAQVAATLKKEERPAEKAANQNDSEDPQVP